MNFSWQIFWEYLWPPSALGMAAIRNGLVVTIYMSIAAEALGIALGTVLALMRISDHLLPRTISITYSTYIRGTPLLVQLAVIYFGTSGLGLYRFPDANIGEFVIPGAVQAGIIGLAVNEAAYMSEIVRAGILSIDSGQMEAARAIGMTWRVAMRRTILPQAVRIILPPLGNQFNGMIKTTSLVFTLGATELFNAYQQANSLLFRPMELYLAVSFYYLALTLVWNGIQSRLERTHKLEKDVSVQHERLWAASRKPGDVGS